MAALPSCGMEYSWGFNRAARSIIVGFDGIFSRFTGGKLPFFSVRRLATRILELAGARRALLRWSAWEYWYFGEPEIRLLRYLVDPEKIALDIGAADGVYTFYLQRLAKRCIAFEPNPISFSNLKRALPGSEIYQAAISSRDGGAWLRVPVVAGVGYGGWGTIEPQNQFSELPGCDVERFKVRTICPDNMCLDDVGFIKIDVEGHELDVLEGLKQTLSRCQPNLLIEVRGMDSKASLADVRRLLSSLGYTGVRLRDGLLKRIPEESEVGGNVIFIAK